MEWDEEGLEIVRRNVSEDGMVSNLDKRRYEEYRNDQEPSPSRGEEEGTPVRSSRRSNGMSHSAGSFRLPS